jgi:hypothetical protein
VRHDLSANHDDVVDGNHDGGVNRFWSSFVDAGQHAIEHVAVLGAVKASVLRTDRAIARGFGP